MANQLIGELVGLLKLFALIRDPIHQFANSLIRRRIVPANLEVTPHPATYVETGRGGYSVINNGGNNFLGIIFGFGWRSFLKMFLSGAGFYPMSRINLQVSGENHET